MNSCGDVVGKTLLGVSGREEGGVLQLLSRQIDSIEIRDGPAVERETGNSPADGRASAQVVGRADGA
jgi:hypothetical protein